MCVKGDIILVESYKSQGKSIKKHSFIVLDDNGGEIAGVDFDFISLVMSSFNDGDEKKRERKLAYPGNFPIAPEDQDIDGGGNGKSGYVKAEQFYYFKKETIEYKRIGQIVPDIFNLIIEFIEEEMDAPIESIIDNL